MLIYSDVTECESVIGSVMSDSLQLHGLEPPRLLCPWDSPDKNTGVGCRAFLQMSLKRLFTEGPQINEC